MTADILAQLVSHDYLRRASELVDEGDSDGASLMARAAQAEVDDPETVTGPFCKCPDCVAYMVMVARLRSIG